MGIGEIRYKIGIIRRINIWKTFLLNFKMLPFSQAKKFPIVVYGRLTTSPLTGSIEIHGPIKRNMIRFGAVYEMTVTSQKTAQLTLKGKIIFKGRMDFGLDTIVVVNKGATLILGEYSGFGSRSKIFCCRKIVFGRCVRISYESLILDDSAHPIKNVLTDEISPMSGNVILGDYNYAGNRVTILPGTKTPNNFIMCSSALCNKDYTSLGENCMIGGVPARFIKGNVKRDFESETFLFE